MENGEDSAEVQGVCLCGRVGRGGGAWPWRAAYGLRGLCRAERAMEVSRGL